MRINVKVLKGQECQVAVSLDASVLEVKQQLQNQVSIPVDQQKLIYQGKALSDDKLLSQYKITDGAKLFLMLKKPGGGVTPSTSSSGPSQTPVKSPDVTPMAVDAQDEIFTVTDDPTGFWTNLTTFLKRHFTERDAAKVLKEFKKESDGSLRKVSLDDIERMAANRLNDTKGYFHPPRT